MNKLFAEAASTMAGPLDALVVFLIIVTLFFTIGIGLWALQRREPIIYLLCRYSRSRVWGIQSCGSARDHCRNRISAIR